MNMVRKREVGVEENTKVSSRGGEGNCQIIKFNRPQDILGFFYIIRGTNEEYLCLFGMYFQEIFREPVCECVVG